MAGPVTVNVDLPTDNNDALLNTALDPIPGPGILLLYLASSQRDGVLTIGGPGVVSGTTYRIPPVLRASGIPDLEADIPTVLEVKSGKVLVTYDEVTAGDAFLSVSFIAA